MQDESNSISERGGASQSKQKDLLLQNIQNIRQASENQWNMVDAIGGDEKLLEKVYKLVTTPNRDSKQNSDLDESLGKISKLIKSKISHLLEISEESLTEIPEPNPAFYSNRPVPRSHYLECLRTAEIGGFVSRLPEILDKYGSFMDKWRESVAQLMDPKDLSPEEYKELMRSKIGGGVGHYYSKIPAFLRIVLNYNHIPEQTRQLARDYVEHTLEFYQPDEKETREMKEIVNKLEEKQILNLEKDEDLFEKLTNS